MLAALSYAIWWRIVELLETFVIKAEAADRAWAVASGAEGEREVRPISSVAPVRKRKTAILHRNTISSDRGGVREKSEVHSLKLTRCSHIIMEFFS